MKRLRSYTLFISSIYFNRQKKTDYPQIQQKMRFDNQLGEEEEPSAAGHEEDYFVTSEVKCFRKS